MLPGFLKGLQDSKMWTDLFDPKVLKSGPLFLTSFKNIHFLPILWQKVDSLAALGCDAPGYGPFSNFLCHTWKEECMK